MSQGKKYILWVDDEILQLRPHILFLEEKGYNIKTATNGQDAVSLLEDKPYDIVLLDEMMPGLDGLSTLEKIKDIAPNIPIIMITKSEKEGLMDDAIGREITDYLIKPVNPKQILSSLKKIFDKEKIIEKRTARDYTGQYRKIIKDLSSVDSAAGWFRIARWLARWDLTFDKYPDIGLIETHQQIRNECNREFAKFVEDNYVNWLHSKDRPMLSVDVVPQKVLPELATSDCVVFMVIDCMRYDQWLAVEPILNNFFDISTNLYLSILPTATPFSRNALFSGLFPSEFQSKYNEYWQRAFKDSDSHNRFEHQLLDKLLIRAGIRLDNYSKYIKILDPEEGEYLLKRLDDYLSAPLTSVVVNFLDILIHSRSYSEVIHEISLDERSVRAVMRTWFLHSPLFSVLKEMSKRKRISIIITTDHGSILARRATKAYGRKDASSNLRYKYGDNINADEEGAIVIKDLEEYKLPAFSLTSSFIIAKEDYFFVYPSNYSEYEQQYEGSIVHGGISIEEMIVPIIRMTPKED